MKKRADQELEISLKGRRLFISIGANTLGFAALSGPYFTELEMEDRKATVTNPVAFAAEIVRALHDEDEDGTTLIHKMLDEAAKNAFENGAEGIEAPEPIYREI